MRLELSPALAAAIEEIQEKLTNDSENYTIPVELRNGQFLAEPSRVRKTLHPIAKARLLLTTVVLLVLYR